MERGDVQLESESASVGPTGTGTRPLRVPGGSIDLRQVEQDVFIWELRPSLGIQVPCSLAAKGVG